MNLNDQTFEIQEKIIKGTFYCKIISKEENQTDLQYAYYLFNNNVRVKTKWYSESKSVNFKLDTSGIYHIACFVKLEGKPVIKLSKLLQYSNENNNAILEPLHNNKIYKISIFGSCVSRDLLEYGNKEMLELKTYIARQSIISAVSKPLNCNIENVKLESNFQRKQVYGDMVKNSFDLLGNDDSEFLIIDLIDERFSLIKHNDTILTYSNELMISEYIGNIVKLKRKTNKHYYLFKKNKKNAMVDDVNMNFYLDEFSDRILKIYKCDNIIIHKAKMLNYYKNISGEIKLFPKNYLISNKKINDILDYMYDYLIYKLPNAIVIDMCDDFSADESHRWGLAPMHYQKEYYLKVFSEITNLLNNEK